MPQISADLITELLETLGQCDLAERLRNEVSKPSSNNPGVATTVDVPWHAIAEFRHAMQLASTTAWMSRRSKKQADWLRATADRADELLPLFECFSHQSDAECAIDLLHQGFRFEAIRENWGRWTIALKHAGNIEFKAWLREGLSEHGAKELADKINGFANEYL